MKSLLLDATYTPPYPVNHKTYAVKQSHRHLTPSISHLITERNSVKQANNDKALFAIADPQFSNIATPEAYRDESEIFYTWVVREFNVFTTLPETRTEVEKISQLLQPGKSEIVTGQQASKTSVKAKQLYGFRYLHFATHGILGNQLPGVNEPALVMTPDAGKNEDAFLTLSEIEQLKLNSDLTVLSACDTGSGKYYNWFDSTGIYGVRQQCRDICPWIESHRKKAQHTNLVHPYYWVPFVLTGE